MSLIKIDAVVDYVKTIDLGFPEVEEVVQLEGGYVNYIYRVKFRVEWRSQKSVVLKYTSDHMRLFTQMKMDSSRQEYEYEGLKLLKENLPADYVAQIPKVLHYDETNRVIIMQDLGDLLSLKQRIIQNLNSSSSQAKEIGRGLAQFLLFVHSFPTSTQILKTFQHDLGRRLATNGPSIIVERCRTLLNLTEDQIQIMSKAADLMIKSIFDANQQLTVGDFWTGNILVDSSGDKNLKLYVVDYEAMKIGVPELDVSQMIAEMYLAGRHYHTSDNLQLMIDEFLTTWMMDKQQETTEIRKEKKRMIMIGFGVHLMRFYSDWSTPESPDVNIKAVQLGADYVLDGSGDMVDSKKIFTFV